MLYKVVTFCSLDETLVCHCDHSYESCWAITFAWHCCFSKFYKMKFENLALLGVKGVNVCHVMTTATDFRTRVITNLQQISFTVPLQRSVPLLISSRQLTLLIFELLQLLKFWNAVHVAHLIVQCKECHRRVNCLSALGTQSYNLFPNQMQRLQLLVNTPLETRQWVLLGLLHKLYMYTW